MSKKKPFNVTAILTADIHCRMDNPICRLDSYPEALAAKMAEIKKLQEIHTKQGIKPPVLDAGDLFHRPAMNIDLLMWAMDAFPVSFYTIPGNHDLEGHSLKTLKTSAVQVAARCGLLNIIHDPAGHVVPTPMGNIRVFGHGWKVDTPIEAEDDISRVLLKHILTFEPKDPPYPGATGAHPEGLLNKYVEADLIVTGDNHQTITHMQDDEGYQRWLINPGSLMRSTAAQIGHQPAVFLWDCLSGECRPHYMPVSRDVITKDHLVQQDIHDERMKALASSFSAVDADQIDFEVNLKNYLRENPQPEPVESEIWEIYHEA